MNDLELKEKIMKPFLQFAEGLEKSIDPKLAAPLVEFFSKAVEVSFNSQNPIMQATVGEHGTLHAIGMDGNTLFSQKCPITENPEALQEICSLMVAMTEGTRRAIQDLK